MTHGCTNGVYEWLMGGGDAAKPAGHGDADRFDAHVLACVIGLAAAEAGGIERFSPIAIGLGDEQFAAFIRVMFPHAEFSIGAFNGGGTVERSDDESCLHQLLLKYTSADSAIQRQLSAIVARRALKPNHLWQDLGLSDRSELSLLMSRHFQPLAARNANNMKWKKFLYRMICRDEGYRLCTAPCCAECDDFSVCFGEESGESLLANNRRKMPSPLVVIS